MLHATGQLHTISVVPDFWSPGRLIPGTCHRVTGHRLYTDSLHRNRALCSLYLTVFTVQTNSSPRHHVTICHMPSKSVNIVTYRHLPNVWCLVMALGCPGMPWRHGRLWWCLSRPGSREGHNGTEDNQRQPKTTSELFKTEKNWRRAKILTVSLDRRSELTAHRWL